MYKIMHSFIRFLTLMSSCPFINVFLTLLFSVHNLFLNVEFVLAMMIINGGCLGYNNQSLELYALSNNGICMNIHMDTLKRANAVCNIFLLINNMYYLYGN